MPTKKKKYNARFPAGRIKKIMQTDEEVGKVAQAVPVIISRTLELFVESLLKKAMQITSAKNAKTLSPSHMKQCILSESRFDFLKDLVKNLPDVANCEGEEGNSPFLSSPSSFGNSANPEVSGAARRLSEQRALRLSTEESPLGLLSQPLSAQPVLTPSSNQLHANFYKETDGDSPSYGQVPVASEITKGRSSVVCINPVNSPKPAATVISTVSEVKPDNSGSGTLQTPGTTVVPVVNAAKTEGSESGAFHLHTPIVIPQYLNSEPIVLDDEADAT